MDILLIASYLGGFTGGNVYPLGISYISTAIKKHKVYTFDPNFTKKPYIETEDIIKKVNPDIIGISLRNIEAGNSGQKVSFYQPFKHYLKFIKKNAPKAKIVVGGSGFSIYAKEIMEELTEIDYGVFLEGEESFPELLDNLDTPQRVKGIYYRDNKKVVFTGNRKLLDFDKLPIPRRDILNIKPYLENSSSYVVGIQTKRGCPFKCSYCTYKLLAGSYIRTRSVKQVVDEIEQLVALGMKHFHFADNMFNVPLKHAEDICDEMIKRKIDVKWVGWYHEKYLTESLLLKAKEAGCIEFVFSPDGASQQTLDMLNKDITPLDIIRTYELCKKIKDVKFSFCFLYNIPGENFKTFFQFLKLALKFKLKGFRLDLSSISVMPDTKIFQIALKKNMVKSKAYLLNHPVYYEELFLIKFLFGILRIIFKSIKSPFLYMRAIFKNFSTVSSS